VWQLALAYTDLMVELADLLPDSKRYNLQSQLRRAATSVALNIAEGSTGLSHVEQARFLSIAVRSLLETVTCQHIIKRRGYLAELSLLRTAYAEAEILFRKLQAMRSALTGEKNELRQDEPVYDTADGRPETIDRGGRSIVRRLPSVRAVIFDFDGVILESTHIKTDAFVELFAAYPQHQAAVLQHHLANLGISRYEKFAWIYRELLGQPFTEAERERLGCDFSHLVLDKILRCPFVPGALETLQALHGRCLTFVASGTPQEELELIVEKRGLAPYFNAVWGTPAQKPDIVRRILAGYELLPEEVLFVGDGVSDYEAAVATNLHFLARSTPELADQWQALGATTVADLRDFLTVVTAAPLP
jgi:four helix bundle protein